jgi:hypothetical protein
MEKSRIGGSIASVVNSHGGARRGAIQRCAIGDGTTGVGRSRVGGGIAGVGKSRVEDGVRRRTA